jgi:hypothetical protein
LFHGQTDGQTNRQPDSYAETSSLLIILGFVERRNLIFFIKIFIFPPILPPLGLCCPRGRITRPSLATPVIVYPFSEGYFIDGVSCYFVTGKRKNFYNENNNVHDLGREN